MDMRLKNSLLEEDHNILTKGQCLFVQKCVEIFDVKTIDTYKPRLTNTRTILIEYVDILKKINASILKESQREPIYNEAMKKIKADLILKNNDNSLYTLIINRLNNKKYTITKQIDDFENILRKLDINYLNWILSALKNNIDFDNLYEILNNIDILSTELISRGWSKGGLYRLIKKIFYEKENDFESKWQKFVEDITSEKVEFRCYIKVEADEFYKEYIEGSDLKIKLVEDVNSNRLLDSEIKETLINKINNYLKINSNEKYFMFYGKAYSNDLGSFAEFVVEELSKIESEYKYFDKTIRFAISKCIMILPTNTITLYNINDLIKESFKINGVKPSIKMNKYKQIQNDMNNIETKKRLNNVFAQYRLGFDSKNIENNFSSFWFALESLVSTQQYDNIIEKIISVVCPISTLRYIRLIIMDLVKDLENFQIDLNEIFLENNIGESNTTNSSYIQDEVAISQEFQGIDIDRNIINLVKILKDETLKESLKSKVSDYSLLYMRVEKISQIIKNSTTFRNFLENHYENIKLHIIRIYRIRNSFVHSANIEYDLYPITMHVHSYLIDVLDEILNALDKGCVHGKVGQIYSCCDLKYNMLITMLKQQKERDFDIRNIFFDVFCDSI